MKAKIWNKHFWVDETDPEKLTKQYKSLLELSGFTIISELDHYFNPYGYTCLFLLAESHLAIHTFPEENKTYIELSSCVKKQFNKFLKLV